MASVAVAAGKQKPTRLGQFLDTHRWLRWAVLIGFMTLISNPQTTTASGHWYEIGDAVVTGLATGGGAKPVHDLLTRIRLAVPL